LEDFYKDNRNKDGAMSVCKKCHCKAVAKRQKDNPEKHYRKQIEWRKKNNKRYREIQKDSDRRYRLRTLYDITPEQYLEMALAQDYKCANPGCRKEAELVIDHCHKTGKVRGLLCRECNLLLGQAKDSPEILLGAMQYLENHS
jgi:hypothetical protein